MFKCWLHVLVQAIEQLTKDEPSEKMGSARLFWLHNYFDCHRCESSALIWTYCRSSGIKIVTAYAKV
jgi:hypothetical protein